jgi:hypothetical protein
MGICITVSQLCILLICYAYWHSLLHSNQFHDVLPGSSIELVYKDAKQVGHLLCYV